MKKILLSLGAATFFSGCAYQGQDASPSAGHETAGQGKSLSSVLEDALGAFSPASQAKKAREPVLRSAVEMVEAGVPGRQACAESMRSAGLTREAVSLLESECFTYTLEAQKILAERKREAAREQKSQEESRRAAEAASKAQKEKEAFAREIGEIKAGRKNIQSIKQAVAIYDAKDGLLLANAPKVKPDGNVYYLVGFIDTPKKNEAAFTAKSAGHLAAVPGGAESSYLHVRIPKALQAEYYDRARVGSPFTLVGKYSENVDYQTVIGQRKTMPLFDAIYIQY